MACIKKVRMKGQETEYDIEAENQKVVTLDLVNDFGLTGLDVPEDTETVTTEIDGSKFLEAVQAYYEAGTPMMALLAGGKLPFDYLVPITSITLSNAAVSRVGMELTGYTNNMWTTLYIDITETAIILKMVIHS